jgi:hypothetical protein
VPHSLEKRITSDHVVIGLDHRVQKLLRLAGGDRRGDMQHTARAVDAVRPPRSYGVDFKVAAAPPYFWPVRTM